MILQIPSLGIFLYCLTKKQIYIKLGERRYMIINKIPLIRNSTMLTIQPVVKNNIWEDEKER
jgi:hypothetical protein